MAKGPREYVVVTGSFLIYLCGAQLLSKITELLITTILDRFNAVRS